MISDLGPSGSGARNLVLEIETDSFATRNLIGTIFAIT